MAPVILWGILFKLIPFFLAQKKAEQVRRTFGFFDFMDHPWNKWPVTEVKIKKQQQNKTTETKWSFGFRNAAKKSAPLWIYTRRVLGRPHNLKKKINQPTPHNWSRTELETKRKTGENWMKTRNNNGSNNSNNNNNNKNGTQSGKQTKGGKVTSIFFSSEFVSRVPELKN